MFSKVRDNRLESIKEDEKSKFKQNKKSVAFRQSGQAMVLGLGVNQDI